MTTIVRMPQLGESIVEGTVARWLKNAGDPIEKLEPLLEVSTDKIDTEVPSPASGVLLDIVVPEGQTVDVGTVLGHIGAAGQQVEQAHVEAAAAEPTKTQKIAASSPANANGQATTRPKEKPSGRDFVSPVVARIVREHSLDLSQIQGTGMGGRVTKKDVMAVVDSGASTSGLRPRSADESTTEVAALATAMVEATSESVLQPLSTMRKAIAAHMVQSKATSPHVTTIFEVDMTAVVQHREAHKSNLAERGIALTFTPYFVAATADALRQVPMVNGQFTDDGIRLQRRVHVGVAVALQRSAPDQSVAIDDGLVVPVLRDADEKNLRGLARSVNELAQRARAGQLTPDETRGGTFTITNHGTSGSLIGTPIINQPQAGILGIGAIVKRPVVRSANNSLLPSADDTIAIRPMCYLNFTFDHRILDGATADKFISIIKQKLETWN